MTPDHPADPSDLLAKIADLDARVRELEAVQQLTLRLMATTKPLDTVLEQFGATETQENAFYTLLDDLVTRARGREQDRPTFAYFEMQLGQIFPKLRGDREFSRLLVDILKLERPAYRELHAYAAAHGWPTGG
jgi:acetyl-CoA carboxylase alpha subunit